MHGSFTASDSANFIAATAVAYAEGFVAGRCDADKLYTETVGLHFDLEAVERHNDPAAKSIVDHARLLIIAMTHACATKDPARLDRWREVMTSLAKLVRMEVPALREAMALQKTREDLQAELAELEAKNEAATSWGGAVGARSERIKEIRSQLAEQS